MTEAGKLAWLLNETAFKDEKNKRTLLEGRVDLEEALQNYRESDPYTASAGIMSLSGGEGKGSIPFKMALVMVLYRFYTSRIKLMIIREDIETIKKIITKNSKEDLIKWFKERSLTVYRKSYEKADKGRKHYFCSLPYGTAAPRVKEQYVKLREGECFLMLVDQQTSARDFAPRNKNVRTVWINGSPAGFEDLSLRLNRKLYKRLRSQKNIREEGRWMELAGLGGCDEMKLGNMTAGQRFLFHLAAMASLETNCQCCIIEKPLLKNSEQNFFWNVISEILQKGKAAMVITGKLANMAGGSRVGILRDGIYLGSMERSEVEETKEFLWCRCRIVDPESARIVPPHHLKIDAVTGDLWLAVGPGQEKSDLFGRTLLEDYGILIHSRESHRPTLEEKLVKLLKDRTSSSSLGWF